MKRITEYLVRDQKRIELDNMKGMRNMYKRYIENCTDKGDTIAIGFAHNLGWISDAEYKKMNLAVLVQVAAEGRH